MRYSAVARNWKRKSRGIPFLLRQRKLIRRHNGDGKLLFEHIERRLLHYKESQASDTFDCYTTKKRKRAIHSIVTERSELSAGGQNNITHKGHNQKLFLASSRLHRAAIKRVLGKYRSADERRRRHNGVVH